MLNWIIVPKYTLIVLGASKIDVPQWILADYNSNVTIIVITLDPRQILD
jgi:hypothetical protein